MSHEAKVIAGGKIVLPAKVRRSLGIEVGDSVLIDEREGYMVITTRQRRLRDLQQEFRRRVPDGPSLADALLAERRSEALREADGAPL
jgi:AbrB family looped-hinge helix DNA binding protein